MKFTIECRSGSWYCVACGDLIFDGLCWDELLGVIAKLCLTRVHGSRGYVESRWRNMHTHKWTWTVTETAHDQYTIEDGTGRFSEILTFSELLGFVARYTYDGTFMFSGLQTYDQRIQRFRFTRERKIAGLLPAPKETTA